jgi:uncharacterized protein
VGRLRVAIVGSGVAGLGCAHALRGFADTTLFEQIGRIGGHCNTVDASLSGSTATFDTGFMVFNRVTYPRLCRLFDELKVPVRPTDMSFSVRHDPDNFEYAGTGWNGLFAQRRNLFNPRFWRMLATIDRFNREAVRALSDPQWEGVTLGDYVIQRGYGSMFLHRYLIPMSGAVWSSPPERMMAFPAATLLRFFHNHGFLGLYTQHPWWTVQGGSREYVKRLVAGLDATVKAGDPVVAVARSGGGVDVRLASGASERFDRVVLAAHADESLQMLSDADEKERSVLGAFRYQANTATVHTDASVMPKTRRAWSAWNCRITRESEGRETPHTVYWMNRLQGLQSTQNWFVSINGSHLVARNLVEREIAYTHPLFDLAAVRAQPQLPLLHRRPGGAVFFAGAYFRYGFHEDGLAAGQDAAEAIKGRPPLDFS